MFHFIVEPYNTPDRTASVRGTLTNVIHDHAQAEIEEKRTLKQTQALRRV